MRLAGGTYLVRQILPDVLSSTPVDESRQVSDGRSADDRDDIDGGDRYRPSEIHGIKFEDINGNGVRDAGEPGVEGVTIFIDLDRDNVFDEGIVSPTLTLADGSYEFLDRKPVPTLFAKLSRLAGFRRFQ
ncbi:MAG: SdrD B-like domain-containing protein [Planctomycetaceae bacterium]